ncbi:MAG: polysaccharide deacetylase family protein, partial [Solirubrobacteraceae bacterium]
ESSDLQRRRAQRARDRRRRLARRRITALGTVVVVIAVIVIVATSTGGGAPSAKPGNSGGAPISAGSRRAHRGHRHASGSGRGASASIGSHHGSTAAVLGPGTGHPGTDPVPVLMYHVIAPPPRNAPFPGLYVLPHQFAAQMQALKQAGWHPVTLDQLRAYWTDGARLPPGKPIVLTFDNGYHSQYAEALPVLRRLHWVADENIQLTGLPPSQGGMTPAQVRALIAAGWELDTQGMSHADLVTLDAPGLRYQIVHAREQLRREYRVPVNWFCYPSGDYDATVIAAVRSAGFIGSTTVVPGWASPSSDPYRLPRLRVLGGTSPQALLAQIASTQGSAPPPSSYTVG